MHFFSAAKINLCLDVLERTPSGYHKIRTVLHEIPQLSDEITIEQADKYDSTSILNPGPNSPIHQEENLAHKALVLMKRLYKIDKKFRIEIKKLIPISSGLGGASSNAATVLKAINMLANLNIPPHKLEEIASHLGADVPFFIHGGTQYAENFGEKLTPLPPVKMAIEIRPGTASKTSTASQYDALDLSKCGQQTAKTDALLDSIKNNQPIEAHFHNDFEQLYEIPPKHHLTGSGPSLFRCFI